MDYQQFAVGNILVDDYFGLQWVVDEVQDDCMWIHQNQPNGVKMHVSDTTCRIKFHKM